MPTFSVPHEVRSSLDRNWRSMGELIHNATEKVSALSYGSAGHIHTEANIKILLQGLRKALYAVCVYVN